MSIIFNIYLVKMGARPSTFIDSINDSNILLNNRSFVDIINHDNDLIMDFFYTETSPNLVIYDYVRR